MSSKPESGSETNPIEFTETALAEARAAMAAASLDPEENGLRVMAREKNCDCGSLSYGMRFESEPAEEDRVSSYDGLQVFVDPESYEYVEGATVDYVSETGRAGFTVDPPVAKTGGGCGCGGHHH
ncbi:iron-sulfur cluster assembly accessory protein [Halanaeroarchaeum sp. HSR-CO]|uniref:iron-sulfur cluster assembly accessory protein n=1 Tax=Halanaeroarchaeum sp. HSR-CO TaxID=2866382 RepID=UPI00217CFA59|nr:iron-sulfur cluster assembly accessory protein [Halanaeroarchaeum sp. HSR-CO]